MMRLNNDTNTQNIGKKNGVLMARISSFKQFLQGGSLDNQLNQVHQLIDRKGITIKKTFDYVESGDPEIDGVKFQKIIDYCLDRKNKVKFLVFVDITRFTRGGVGFYLSLKAKLAKGGVQIIDTRGIIGKSVNTLEHLGVEYEWSKTNPTETSEIMEAKKAKDEKTTILTRLIGAEIVYRRKGYVVGAPPIGLINKIITTSFDGVRKISAPHPEESKWIIKLFNLRAQGVLDDKQIVEKVNALGFLTKERNRWDKSGNKPVLIGKTPGKPLNVKQLQRLVKKTEYAGIICDKRTKYQPVECVGFDGLIDIETFNRANRGKIAIIKNDEGVKIVRDYKPPTRLKNNPLYPFKSEVACHLCKKLLLGSAPRSKSGKPSPRYHCARGHKYWSVKRETFHEQMCNFAKNIKFDDDFFNLFKAVVLDVWERKKKEAEQDSIDYGQQALNLREEKQMITNKILRVESDTAIKALEERLKKVEAKLVVTTELRDKREDKELNITSLINHAKYFMEHLEDLLIDESNPIQQADYFSLLFDRTPTYEEIVNGTPKLSPIFNLNTQPSLSKSTLVIPRGIEPRFSP